MTQATSDPRAVVQPLVHTRQYREFTDEPVRPDELDAIVDAARWSGSSQNTQPWRFVVVRDRRTLDALAEIGMPQTRSLRTANAGVAIAMPDDPSRQVSHAFDEGRAAERALVAATMLGLGAGIAWIRKDVRPKAAELLGLPDDRFVRTIVSVGHPTASARAPKAPRGQGRLPRSETVHTERWGRR